MGMVKLFLLISIVVGLTHLIKRKLNTDMSFGFVLGMMWSVFIIIISEIFTQ